MPRLRILTGTRQDDLIALAGPAMRLGRDPGVEISLPDDRASREHARLVPDGDAWAIEDLSSVNGTWVNGLRQRRVRLRVGDVLMIGSTAMRLEPDPAPPPTSASPGGDRALLQCLLEIQRLMGTDAPRLTERAIETLFPALPASRLSLFSVEGNEVHQGFTATRSGGEARHMSHAFARKVLAAGKAMLVDASDDSSDAWGMTLQEQQVRTVLGVPVQVAGKPVAVLLCDNLEEPGRLTAEHIGVLEFVAEALSHVLQRAELKRLEAVQAKTEAQFLAARRVQEQIFNKDPTRIAGDVAWTSIYQPALELGGDFFDFHSDEQCTTWIVADVSGKGVPAALVVSMLKAFCKSLYPLRPGPRDLLLGLDDLLRGELPLGMFLTAAVFQVDRAGLVRHVNVGHPEVLIIRADGAVEDLPPTAGMVGLWPRALLESRLVESEHALHPGDRIFACTDGLTEAMGAAGECFGLERIRAQVAADRALDPGRALSHLLEAMDDFARHAARGDDVTLVLGHRRG